MKFMGMEYQCICDVDEGLLRDKDIITQRWSRLIYSMPDSKAEKLDPGTTSKLPHQTFKTKLGVEITEGEEVLTL